MIRQTRQYQKKKKKKKNWRWHHFGKLWFHCLFSDLWPVYSHPEAWFRTHGLILLLWVKSLFLSKILIFCKKIKKNSKTIFFETTYVGIYILICKFPAQSPSSAPSPPTAKRTPKKPILIGVNKINAWANQWKITLNIDLNKKSVRGFSFRKIKKTSHFSMNFNSNSTKQVKF